MADGSLIFDTKVDTSGVSTGLEKVEKDVSKHSGNLMTGLEKFSKIGLGIGAAVIGGTTAAVTGLFKMGEKVSETARNWIELSEKTDMGIVSLQQWAYAAKKNNVDIETLSMGIKTLSATTVSAKDGNDEAISSYKELGISIQDLQTMTPDQIFEKTAYALADMQDGVDKNALGSKFLQNLVLKEVLTQHMICQVI